MKLPFDSKTPLIITQKIKIDAPVIQVWSVLTGINQWHTWQSGSRKAYLKNDLQEGAEFRTTSRMVNFKARIHTCQKFHAFGWSKKKLGFFVSYNWVLESEKEGTNVFVEQHSQGFFIGLRKKILRKKLEAKISRRLNELKHASEHV